MEYRTLQDSYRLLCEAIQLMAEAGVEKESPPMQKLLWSAEKLRKSALHDWNNYKEYIRPVYQAFLTYL